MKILILGGQGNLGTQLVKVFAADFETIAWDRADLDVLDFSLLNEKITELAPNLIINTVAYNAVDKCEDKEEFELALKLNAELPAVLAEIALERQITLIHYSTDYVFSGTAEKKEFTEEDTPNPINKYGESKFAGEREILKRAEQGLNFYLIRTSKLFGPKGSSPVAKPSFFDIMSSLAQDKKELTVVNEELSCFTYTLDLALATKRLWELETPFGIYHLVNEGACTWFDGAEALFALKNIEVDIKAVRSENLLRAARRPKFSVLKNLKVKKLRHWQDALKEYISK
ncbi:dTDP-4-dehydrorhamnose reductase [Candidatus Falkowbacteria bacterium]|jgi:dTDP-4-dehydrorhamnose reductase|nr:dTDP-4-dehydrorhamnose reductase [Candidatus Falkowbacteria bacterium]